MPRKANMPRNTTTRPLRLPSSSASSRRGAKPLQRLGYVARGTTSSHNGDDDDDAYARFRLQSDSDMSSEEEEDVDMGGDVDDARHVSPLNIRQGAAARAVRNPPCSSSPVTPPMSDDDDGYKSDSTVEYEDDGGSNVSTPGAATITTHHPTPQQDEEQHEDNGSTKTMDDDALPVPVLPPPAAHSPTVHPSPPQEPQVIDLTCISSSDDEDDGGQIDWQQLHLALSRNKAFSRDVILPRKPSPQKEVVQARPAAPTPTSVPDAHPLDAPTKRRNKPSKRRSKPAPRGGIPQGKPSPHKVMVKARPAAPTLTSVSGAPSGPPATPGVDVPSTSVAGVAPTPTSVPGAQQVDGRHRVASVSDVTPVHRLGLDADNALRQAIWRADVAELRTLLPQQLNSRKRWHHVVELLKKRSGPSPPPTEDALQQCYAVLCTPDVHNFVRQELVDRNLNTRKQVVQLCLALADMRWVDKLDVMFRTVAQAADELQGESCHDEAKELVSTVYSKFRNWPSDDVKLALRTHLLKRRPCKRPKRSRDDSSGASATTLSVGDSAYTTLQRQRAFVRNTSVLAVRGRRVTKPRLALSRAQRQAHDRQTMRRLAQGGNTLTTTRRVRQRCK